MKPTAHEIAVAEANAFLYEHPEFRQANTLPTDNETGETDRTEHSDWLGGLDQKRKHVGLGGYGDLEMMETAEDRPALFEVVWPDAGRTRSQRWMDVWMEKLIEKLRPNIQELVRLYFFERMSQGDLAKLYGISQQAINSRMRTAERALRRAIAEHGETIEVSEEEL